MMQTVRSNFAETLNPAELQRLSHWIRQEYEAAKVDHDIRMRRWDAWARLFRNLPQEQAVDENGVPNYEVPILQWVALAWAARMVDAVVGEDAEVVAVPTGPSDAKIAPKIGVFMKWMLESGMNFVPTWLQWILQAGIYGRAIVYRPWEARFMVGADGEQKKVYDGPKCRVLRAEDIVLPSDDEGHSIHEVPWACVRTPIRPQALLDGERAGRYFGIQEAFGEIIQHSLANGPTHDNLLNANEIQTREEAEGVQLQMPRTQRETLWLYEWYGRWRLPRTDAVDENGVPLDAELTDFERRNMDEEEICVRILPGLNWRIVGIERLHEIYPNMEHPRPLNDLRFLHTGEQWPMGLAEIVETHQAQATTGFKQFSAGATFAAGPPVFFKPSSGYNPTKMKLAPFTAYPCEDPSGVQQLRYQAQVEILIQVLQFVLGIVEKLTGISDLALGRSSDRPNAPRTATGQVAILEQGNTRAKLDRIGIASDLSTFLFDLWELWGAIGPEETFFRVTEEEAGGLFETRDGFSTLTPEERSGRFDFKLKFATSAWGKAAAAQETLQRYQLDLANPLIISNPKALWQVTRKVHEALGDPNFSDLVPEPPDLDNPRNPMQEWTLMLQNEEVHVHPLDQDQLHIAAHQKQLERAISAETRDPDAEVRLMTHIGQHEEQAQRKAAVQQLLSTAMAAMSQAGAMAPQGEQPPPESEAAAPPSPAGSPVQAARMPGGPQPEMPAAGAAIQQQMQGLMGAQ